MTRRLTELERLFCEAYVGEARGNGTLAARLAGYGGKPSTLATRSKQLLARERVAAYLEELRGKRQQEAIATKDELLSFLTAVLRGEVTAQRVTPTGDVVTIGPSLAERRAAGRDIARIEGWITPDASPSAGGRSTVIVVVGTPGQDLREIGAASDAEGAVLVLPDNGRRALPPG